MKLFYFILLVAVLNLSTAKRLKFENRGGETVWVGSLGNDGKSPINGGGWEMKPGSQVDVDIPDDWAGRFWPRIGCNNNGGNFHCDTGDCGNSVQCSGRGGAPPATLAEFTFKGYGGKDYYDISLVDGFNYQVSIETVNKHGSGYDCSTADCRANINGECPNELKLDVNGKTVGCKSACLAFDTDQYCCRGQYNKPETCKSNTWPHDYPQFFKSKCDKAYSYAYDDHKSTFTCDDSDYKIIFG